MYVARQAIRYILHQLAKSEIFSYLFLMAFQAGEFMTWTSSCIYTDGLYKQEEVLWVPVCKSYSRLHSLFLSLHVLGHF